MIPTVKQWLDKLLLPELHRIAPDDRGRAMKRAGEEPIEFLELDQTSCLALCSRCQ